MTGLAADRVGRCAVAVRRIGATAGSGRSRILGHQTGTVIIGKSVVVDTDIMTTVGTGARAVIMTLVTVAAQLACAAVPVIGRFEGRVGVRMTVDTRTGYAHAFSPGYTHGRVVELLDVTRRDVGIGRIQVKIQAIGRVTGAFVIGVAHATAKLRLSILINGAEPPGVVAIAAAGDGLTGK